MSLNDWLADGTIRRQQARRSEIAELLANVDRDLHDAAVDGVSTDGRFSMAYAAALGLATVALRAEGFRATSSGGGHHARTLTLLPETMGPEQRSRARYLDKCRRSRNKAMYDSVGVVTERDVRELAEDAIAFRNDVLDWLREKHPELL